MQAQRLHLALLRGEVPAAPGVAVPAPLASRPSPFPELAFVGRADELATLRDAVERHGVVTLSGPAGSGKSRLVAELVNGTALVSGTALPIIAARAFLPERAEPWGLARTVLREAIALDAAIPEALPARIRAALTELLPELGPPGDSVDGESRRALLLAGALRVLEAATGEGALLVVDDLQWADPSSVTVIGSALARLPRLAAVLAMRPDEVPPATVAQLRDLRDGAVEVTVGPLRETAIRALVDEPALAAAVLAGTDRTPFAVAEVLRELVVRGAIERGPAGGWTPRSADAASVAADVGRAGQLRAVARRADRQDATATEVLRLLALLAREVPASTIAAAAGIDGRAALDTLSRLATAGLARLGEQGWATAHDLVAETVTAALGEADRGRLHTLLARALDGDGDDDGADPAEVAHHHRAAGDTAAAAQAYAAAAHRALARHATREAATSASAGLALAPRPAVRADLLAARAEAGAVHGDLAGAVEDLRAALSDTGSGPLRSRILARLATIVSGARDLRQAAELAELAVVEAGTDAAAQAFALETAAILDMNLERPERARDRAEQALLLYRRLGDGGGVARILDGRRWRPSSTAASPRASPSSGGSRSCSPTPGSCCASSHRSRRAGTGSSSWAVPRTGSRSRPRRCASPVTWTRPRGRPTRSGTGPKRCPGSGAPTRRRPTPAKRS